MSEIHNFSYIFFSSKTSTVSQQQILINYKNYISQASTHHLNLEQAFYIDNTDKTVYYSENPNIKISTAEKEQYALDINTTKRFFGYPIDVTSINGLFLYKVAHTTTDDFTAFNGNIQLARMYLYYYFNKDNETSTSLKEAWHLHYCFEVALRNSIKVDDSGTYRFNNNETQLYGTIENITYKLYNENLVKEAIYQNFENDIDDLNTQLNTEIYKDQTAQQYITPTTYEYGRYTTNQHGLLGVAATLNALLQNTNIAQIIIQDVNLSINNSDVKDLNINQTASQLISNQQDINISVTNISSAAPVYSQKFTTDYNASFADARTKYINDYMQTETNAQRWFDLYTTHPELHYQDIGRYLGYRWQSNDKPSPYIFAGKVYDSKTNRVWGSESSSPYTGTGKIESTNLSPYYVAFQIDGNLCTGAIEYDFNNMRALLQNKLCIESVIRDVDNNYCIPSDKKV